MGEWSYTSPPTPTPYALMALAGTVVLLPCSYVTDCNGLLQHPISAVRFCCVFTNFKFVVCRDFEYVFLKFLRAYQFVNDTLFEYEFVDTFALIFRQMKFGVSAVVFT